MPYDLISKVTIPNSGGTNVTYEIKDAWARDAIEALGNPMDFVGVADSVTATQPSSGYYANIDNKYYVVSHPSNNTKEVGNVITVNISGDPNNQKEYVCIDPGTEQGHTEQWAELGDLSHLQIAPTVVTVKSTNTSWDVGSESGKVHITASGAHGLAANATFTTTVTPTTKKLSTTTITATNGTENVVKSLSTNPSKVEINTTSSGGQSVVTGLTTQKLGTTTITGVSGSTTTHDTPTLNTQNIVTSSFTPKTGLSKQKLATTTVPNVTGADNSKKMVLGSVTGVSGSTTTHNTPTLNTTSYDVKTITGVSGSTTVTVLGTNTGSLVTPATSGPTTAKTWGDYVSANEELQIKFNNGDLLRASATPLVTTTATIPTAASSATRLIGAPSSGTTVALGTSLTEGAAVTVPIADANASTFATGTLATDGTGDGVTTDVTFGTAITVATGSLLASGATGGGAEVGTGLIDGSAITYATGTVSSNGTGSAVGTSLTAGTVVTVPTANANATTVATGSLVSSGGGDSVVTSASGTKYVHITEVTPTTADVAKVASGTTTVVTGISDTAPGSGETGVVTAIASASTTASGSVNVVTDITHIELPQITSTEEGTGHTHSAT